VPAFARCSLDSNQEADGQTNLRFGWKPIRETADGLEIAVTCGHREATFDLSFRRLQRFEVSPGQRLRWEALNSATRWVAEPVPQSGTAVTDKDRLFVLTGLKCNPHATLTVKVARAE